MTPSTTAALIKAASYYVSRLDTLNKGHIVYDLDEAEVALRQALAAIEAQQPTGGGEVEHTLACDIRMKQNPGLADCFCGALKDQMRNDKARATQPPSRHEYDALKGAAQEGKKRLTALERVCVGKPPAQQTQQDVVERVARAMMRTVFHEIDVDKASLDWTGNDVWGCDFEEMARAAIAAMHTPDTRHQRACEVLREGLEKVQARNYPPNFAGAYPSVVESYELATQYLARAETILRGGE